MNLQFPIKLDSAIVLINQEGSEHKITQLEIESLSENNSFMDELGCAITMDGYDSSERNGGKGLRVTNLNFTNHGQIYSACPVCEMAYPLETFSEREIDGFNEQNECDACVGLVKSHL